MTGSKAFAAYNKQLDFLSLSSIGISRHAPTKWINKTHVSGRDGFEVVPVKITVVRVRKTKRRRKSD